MANAATWARWVSAWRASGLTTTEFCQGRDFAAASREQVAELTLERDQLRLSHERVRLELELLERRLFVAKAERVDTAQREREFAAKLRQLEVL